jgi:hypothetical protein
MLQEASIYRRLLFLSRGLRRLELTLDVYFSADVETDGPIPGPYSMLSVALVYAGTYDGSVFKAPNGYHEFQYKELRPISFDFEPEALAVNGLDRSKLLKSGDDPAIAMTNLADWVRSIAGHGKPVLVAYPLAFDWTWLYWYFVKFSLSGSPFDYSRGFDIKTAVAVKTKRTLSSSGRAKLPDYLQSHRPHTHHALDDAIEQAEIFAKVFSWSENESV